MPSPVSAHRLPLDRRPAARWFVLAMVAGALLATAARAAPPASAGSGDSWYVSPAATAEGDGSERNPWTIEAALAPASGIKPGDTVWLRGGMYGGDRPRRFTSRLRGTEERPIVVRQCPGEHATINGGILAEGAWTWFWDFEITNTSTHRVSNAQNRPPGLYLKGRGHKAINLVINNTGHPAVGTWEEVGDGGEVYGCIIWGTGTYDTDRNGTRRGSAIYAQNNEGTRYVRDVISFRNFSTGMKAYTEKAYANGFHFEGNISFDNGDRLLFVSGRDHPAARLKVIANYTYRTPTEDDPPARFGYPDVDQLDAEIAGNYFVNGTHADGAFWVKRFQSLRVTENVFVSPHMLATWIPPSNRGPYTWDRNRYYGGGGTPFRVGAATCSWADWKTRTGFDAASMRTAARPEGVDAFVRPNRYDPARAHLVVYNWAKRDTAVVDLSRFLAPGDRYTIVDAQNYWGPPVGSGSYAGGAVSIPMNLAAVSTIRGDSLVPNIHTSSEFGAFVVFKNSAGPRR